MKLIIVLSVLISFAISQIILPEKCPIIKPMPIKKLYQIIGVWYEIKIFYNDFDEYFSCVMQNVTSFKDNRLISTYNAIMNNTLKEEVTLNAVMTLINQSKGADFLTELYAGYKTDKVVTNVKILNTEYEDCLIYWICDDVENGSQRYAWIQSRNRSISDEVYNSFVEYFDKNNLGSIYLQNKNQNFCNNDISLN